MPFFSYAVNNLLEQSGSQILNLRPITLTFSLFTKAVNRTYITLFFWKKVYNILSRNADCWEINPEVSKILVGVSMFDLYTLSNSFGKISIK